MESKQKPAEHFLHLWQHSAKLGPGERLAPCPQGQHRSILSLELAVFFTFYFLLLPMSFIMFL